VTIFSRMKKTKKRKKKEKKYCTMTIIKLIRTFGSCKKN